MPFRSLRLAGALVALLVTAAAPAAAQEFKLIVHPSNDISQLTAGEATKLFLKEAAAFPNGKPVAPVDLAKGNPVRAAFSKRVLGRPASAVDTYWQQQIFSGREVPPPAKPSDDDVIAFVKSTPGAIGYVSAGASTAGVKVVDVR